MFLSFQHIQSILHVSTNPNAEPNSNTRYWNYIHQTNPNHNPNEKRTRNCANSLKKRSLIPDPTTIFFWQDARSHYLQKIHNKFLILHYALPHVVPQPRKTQTPAFIWYLLLNTLIFFWKGLNQNPWWYTRDYTKQLTRVVWYRPIYSKWHIAHLQKTRLISFILCFNHSLRFDLPTLSLNIFVTSDPTLSRRPRVGRLHSVLISSKLWFDLTYSPPISNGPWRNPVVRLRPVSLWVN